MFYGGLYRPPFCCEKALFQENRYKVTIIILNINDLL
jgi:hypothetical protein